MTSEATADRAWGAIVATALIVEAVGVASDGRVVWPATYVLRDMMVDHPKTLAFLVMGHAWLGWHLFIQPRRFPVEQGG